MIKCTILDPIGSETFNTMISFYHHLPAGGVKTNIKTDQIVLNMSTDHTSSGTIWKGKVTFDNLIMVLFCELALSFL